MQKTFIEMRYLLFILLLFVTANLFSQKNDKKIKTSSPEDEPFITVALRDTINDSKIVAIDIGQKARIYVKMKPIITEAKKYASNDFVKKDYNQVIQYLDSASQKTDTILIKEYYKLWYLQYLVSEQLKLGDAKVYYKKIHLFVDTITHRFEVYGEHGDRFFYLPDKRPFFSVMERTGILDSNNPLGQGHYNAYIKEGEKLQTIREE